MSESEATPQAGKTECVECGHVHSVALGNICIGCPCTAQPVVPFPTAPPVLFSEKQPERFVVKHYSSDVRPTIKGNGFDGLEIGRDREEAEEFINWINARLPEPAPPATSPDKDGERCGFRFEQRRCEMQEGHEWHHLIVRGEIGVDTRYTTAPPATSSAGEAGKPTPWDIAWREGHASAEREIAALRAEVERLNTRLNEAYDHDEKACTSVVGALRMAAAEKARADRLEKALRFLEGFLEIDDVGDEHVVYGLVVKYEALEEAVGTVERGTTVHDAIARRALKETR